MQVIITGKNLQVSDRSEEYVRRKIGRLERHLHEPVEARVELSSENTKNANQRQIVQVTLSQNGTVIRAEERSADMRVAVDAVVDKLDKQIRRYKDKQVRKRRIETPSIAEIAVEETQERVEPRVVRTKRFKTLPMSAEQAVEQMELLGHSFFLFLNEDSDELNVVYRREDGNYGVLEPHVD
jgi:ribosome hibernation promoting factor